MAARAEAARRRVRGSGWRIAVDVGLDARESFGGALCLMWVVGESLERAHWSSGFAQSQWYYVFDEAEWFARGRS